VAPLKPIRRHIASPFTPSFHACKSVAPLKQPRPAPQGAATHPSFHACKSVAPLKRDLRDQDQHAKQVSTLTKAWPH